MSRLSDPAEEQPIYWINVTVSCGDDGAVKIEDLDCPPTTLFDFFWRLRVRSNYQDVDTFLMSSVGEAWHRDFYESLSAVTEHG